MRLRSGVLVAALGIAFMALLAREAATVAAAGPGGAATADAPHAVWNEVKWPFLVDQWGSGRAYRCTGAECGDVATILWRDIGTTRRSLPPGVTLRPVLDAA